MTAPVVPGGPVPVRAPPSHHAPWTTHRTLKSLATLLVALPAVLSGGLVAMVEEPPVALWVLALGVVLVAIVVAAWRWPVPGGILVALLGLWQEWSWFASQLDGDVQAFIDSLGDISPLWFFTLPAVISGALFIAAGVLPERKR